MSGLVRHPSSDGTECQWYETGGEWVCLTTPPAYRVRLSMTAEVAARYLASSGLFGGREARESDAWIDMWFCTEHAATWRQEHHEAVAAREAEGKPPYVYSEYTIQTWPGNCPEKVGRKCP